MASAVNDWQVADWVEPEPRLRASIVPPYEDGDLAAKEIHRCGPNPAFVQILLLARTRDPLGNRRYWKMYEAAEEYNLPYRYPLWRQPRSDHWRRLALLLH